MKKLLCLAVVAAFAPCVGSAPQPASPGVGMAIHQPPIPAGVGVDGRNYFFDGWEVYYIDENGKKHYMDVQLPRNIGIGGTNPQQQSIRKGSGPG